MSIDAKLIGPGSSGSPLLDPTTSVDIDDDFNWGNIGQANVGIGPLQLVPTGNGGGIISSLANTTQPVLGRFGIIQLTTGTTNNATGQGILYNDDSSVYAGNGSSFTLTWAAKTPANLSDVTNEYVIEMGFFDKTRNSVSDNAMAITYKRTTSTNWAAYTAQNGSVTSVTTSDASLAVAASTWYNFKITMTSDGVTASFYVAPAGTQNFVLIGTSTTNLPNSTTFFTFLNFTIYRASTFALARILSLDWARYQQTFNSAR